MFEPTIDGDRLHFPACHLCGRVLTEEDHEVDAGSGGDIFWCCYYHSPEGLDELAGIDAYLLFEADRQKEESLLRLKAIIDDAVADALAARGLA